MIGSRITIENGLKGTVIGESKEMSAWGNFLVAILDDGNITYFDAGDCQNEILVLDKIENTRSNKFVEFFNGVAQHLMDSKEADYVQSFID